LNSLVGIAIHYVRDGIVLH